MQIKTILITLSSFMKKIGAAFISLFILALGTSYTQKTDRHMEAYTMHPVSQYTSHGFISAPSDTALQSKKLSPDTFTVIDTYAKNTPKQYEKDIQTLADYLIKPARTDLEKARALYTWVTTHIVYDDVAFNSGKYPDYSATNVLRRKKAVCEGYTNLLKALCDAAGLEAEKIIGYSKGYSYKPGSSFSKTNHAWNAIKIDSTWRLFDPTWGSGFGTNKNGKLVSTSKFDPYWFNVNPKAFIFSHLPKEAIWQFIENPLTLHMYEKFPYVNTGFFKLGFNPDSVYKDVVSGNVKALVNTYSPQFPIQCNKLPYTQSIPAGKEIVFEIESDYADNIALIDEQSWHYFTKEGNKFILKYIPIGKEVKISVKINSSDESFSTLIKYKVI